MPVSRRKRHSKPHVSVSWYEHKRAKDGSETRLFYGQVYLAADEEGARVILARARANNGWAPRCAIDVQIDLVGVDLVGVDREAA